MSQKRTRKVQNKVMIMKVSIQLMTTILLWRKTPVRVTVICQRNQTEQPSKTMPQQLQALNLKKEMIMKRTLEIISGDDIVLLVIINYCLLLQLIEDFCGGGGHSPI